MFSKNITWAKTNEALATPYLLMKTTSTEDVFTTTEDVADQVSGISTEPVLADDLNDVRQELLNPSGCVPVIASAAIDVGDLVTPAAGGRVAALGVAADTYNVIGHAVKAAAAAGDVIYIVFTGQRPVVVT